MVNSRQSDNEEKRSVEGRRGPAIHRWTKVDGNRLRLTDTPITKLVKRPSSMIKPSLTPGTGTFRIIYSTQRTSEALQFGMEPSSGEEAFQQWLTAIRRMARLGDGLPNFVRRRVWSTLADHHLRAQHIDWSHAVRSAFNENANSEDDKLSSQITKDLHRTGCDQFGSDTDQVALQRVLFAYARWNRRVGYCQGFNVIAAALLEVTERDEKEALKIMVYLVDFVLPESYFAQNLQALSVEIAVFRHLLHARLPNLSSHLDRLQGKAAVQTDTKLGYAPFGSTTGHSKKFHGSYEPPLINVYAIQWFLTLFSTCLAPDAVLRIWDSLFLEGSEIILRTALVIMDFLASRLVKLKSSDQFYSTMSGLMNDFATGRIVNTRELLLEIYELAPFPYPNLKQLREKFMYNITPLVSTSVEEINITMKKNTKQHRQSSLFSIFKTNFGKSHEEERSSTRSDSTLTAGATSNQTNISSMSLKIQHENVIHEDTNKFEDYQEVSLDDSPMTVRRETTNIKSLGSTAEEVKAITDGKSKAANRSNRENLKGSLNIFSTLWMKKSATNGSLLVSDDESVSPTQLTAHSGKSNFSNRKTEHTCSSLGLSTTDISKIGPGAVGEITGLEPYDRTPSSHQARMCVDLNQLKAQYKRQLMRQRRTTLHLPAESALTGNAILFDRAPITAVLPQTKNSKQMEFYSSLDPAAVENIMGNWSEEGSIICRDSRISLDDVFMKSSSDVRIISDKTNHEVGLDRIYRAAAKNLDLIGAVYSWQAKAVWSANPPPDSVGSEIHGTLEDQNLIDGISLSSEPSTNNTKNCKLDLLTRKQKRSTVFKDFRTPQAVSDEVTSETISELSCTYRSTRSDTYYPCSFRRCYSETTVGSMSSSLSHKTKACHNGRRLLRRTSLMNRKSCEIGDDDNLSFFTAKSSRFNQAVIDDEFTNRQQRLCSLGSNAKQIGTGKQRLALQLPLSPGRRQFGVKLGIYPVQQMRGNSKPLSTFSDRIQFITMTRNALAKQISNNV